MKKHKTLKILGCAVLGIALFFGVINLIPPRDNVKSNPFVVEKGSLPMIAAHRGGGANNPENTLPAFREAVQTLGVDILESDLYLTKDGYLVRRAHRRNIAVQYWTINDADEMRMLIEMGVDCIMTDDPALLAQVLEEYR